MLAKPLICDEPEVVFILQVHQVRNVVILHLKSGAKYPLSSYAQNQALGGVLDGSRNSSTVYKELMSNIIYEDSAWKMVNNLLYLFLAVSLVFTAAHLVRTYCTNVYSSTCPPKSPDK